MISPSRRRDDGLQPERTRAATYSNSPGMRARNSFAPASVGTGARSRHKPGGRRTEGDGGCLSPTAGRKEAGAPLGQERLHDQPVADCVGLKRRTTTRTDAGGDYSDMTCHDGCLASRRTGSGGGYSSEVDDARRNPPDRGYSSATNRLVGRQVGAHTPRCAGRPRLSKTRVHTTWAWARLCVIVGNSACIAAAANPTA